MNAAVATAITQAEPYVNISFPIQGHSLHADHGYLLYSAISRITGSAGVPPAPGYAGILPARSPLHKADWLAIELISGFPAGRGLIALNVPQTVSLRSGRRSELRLRIPSDHYHDVLPLAGKRLTKFASAFPSRAHSNPRLHFTHAS